MGEHGPDETFLTGREKGDGGNRESIITGGPTHQKRKGKNGRRHNRRIDRPRVTLCGGERNREGGKLGSKKGKCGPRSGLTSALRGQNKRSEEEGEKYCSPPVRLIRRRVGGGEGESKLRGCKKPGTVNFPRTSSQNNERGKGK